MSGQLLTFIFKAKENQRQWIILLYKKMVFKGIFKEHQKSCVFTGNLSGWLIIPVISKTIPIKATYSYEISAGPNIFICLMFCEPHRPTYLAIFATINDCHLGTDMEHRLLALLAIKCTLPTLSTWMAWCRSVFLYTFNNLYLNNFFSFHMIWLAFYIWTLFGP